MGSGALRLGCNWHKDSPARQGGKGCRLSLPAPQARSVRGLARPHPRGARFLWAVMRSIMSGGSYGKWYALCKL